jgi:hypothetical protein
VQKLYQEALLGSRNQLQVQNNLEAEHAQQAPFLAPVMHPVYQPVHLAIKAESDRQLRSDDVEQDKQMVVRQEETADFETEGDEQRSSNESMRDEDGEESYHPTQSEEERESSQ